MKNSQTEQMEEFFKIEETKQKYALPKHWIMERHHKYGIIYFGYAQIIKEIFSNLKRGYVLDAGCGDGRITHEIQKLGHKVLGIDILETSIQYAKILVPDAEFEVADLVNLDKDETLFEKFDYVNCVEVIEHIHPNYQPTVIKNLNRVLKADGEIIMSFPTAKLPMSKLHYKHFTLDGAEKLLEDSGFEVERVIGNYKINFLSNILLNDKLWKLMWNGYWRFVGIGRLINNLYMKFINYADEGNAGRYIIIGVKKTCREYDVYSG